MPINGPRPWSPGHDAALRALTGVSSAGEHSSALPVLLSRHPASRGVRDMRKTDVTCASCGAGFRRLELWSEPGAKGEYRCPVCDYTVEAYDGATLVAYRLTIQPVRAPAGGATRAA